MEDEKRFKESILTALAEAPDGLTIGQLEKECLMVRQTVSKYVSILEAEKKVTVTPFATAKVVRLKRK